MKLMKTKIQDGEKEGETLREEERIEIIKLLYVNNLVLCDKSKRI